MIYKRIQKLRRTVCYDESLGGISFMRTHVRFREPTVTFRRPTKDPVRKDAMVYLTFISCRKLVFFSLTL